jgi:hypothetical protein
MLVFLIMGNHDFAGGAVKAFTTSEIETRAGPVGHQIARRNMYRNRCLTRATATLVATLAFGLNAARAEHKCDPVTDEGWSVVPTEETLTEVDGLPYQVGTSGNWFVDRTTTVLPFCHYFNAIGNYSLRSYSLAPRASEERVSICESVEGRSLAVAPYTGPCPPK